MRQQQQRDDNFYGAGGSVYCNIVVQTAPSPHTYFLDYDVELNIKTVRRSPCGRRQQRTCFWSIIKFWDWLMPQAWKIKKDQNHFCPNPAMFGNRISVAPCTRARSSVRSRRNILVLDHGVFSRTTIQHASNCKRERQRRGRQAFKSSEFPRGALS